MSSPGNLTGIERRARRAKDGADGADASVTYDTVIAALGFVPARTGGSGPANTDALGEGTSNLYFTAQRVRDVVLTGLSTATNAVVSATDSILSALGKLQAQVSAIATSLSGKVDATAIDTDGTLAANSDTKIPSQKAVKTFVAASVAAGGGTGTDADAQLIAIMGL